MEKKSEHELRFILSRTDSIGDVVLTLPMAGLLKHFYPQCSVYFLGRSYTKDVVALSAHVDGFVNFDELEKMSEDLRIKALKDIDADIMVHVLPQVSLAKLAKQAGIPLRVGTTNRVYHWWYCNRRIALSRKNSNLHESQLNLKLLSFLNIDTNWPLQKMHELYGFTRLPSPTPDMLRILEPHKQHVILHPKSKGSAKEWGLSNFEKLIEQLPSDKYQVFVSGTKQDADLMQEFLGRVKNRAVDITGRFNLGEFIVFISLCDALVAASTGPLHIAAALQKTAIGLFSPKRPIHPGRWRPIGLKAHSVVNDPLCPNCAAGRDCDCIEHIKPKQIVDLLEKEHGL